MSETLNLHNAYPKSSVIGKFTLFSSLCGGLIMGIISVIDTYRLKGEPGDIFQFFMVMLAGAFFLIVPSLVTGVILAQLKMMINKPFDYLIISLIGIVIFFALFFLTGKDINLQGALKFVTMGGLGSMVAAKLALPKR